MIQCSHSWNTNTWSLIYLETCFVVLKTIQNKLQLVFCITFFASLEPLPWSFNVRLSASPYVCFFYSFEVPQKAGFCMEGRTPLPAVRHLRTRRENETNHLLQNWVDHVLWLCFSVFQSTGLIVILQSLPDAFRLRQERDQSLRQHETSKLSPFPRGWQNGHLKQSVFTLAAPLLWRLAEKNDSVDLAGLYNPPIYPLLVECTLVWFNPFQSMVTTIWF